MGNTVANAARTRARGSGRRAWVPAVTTRTPSTAEPNVRPIDAHAIVKYATEITSAPTNVTANGTRTGSNLTGSTAGTKPFTSSRPTAMKASTLITSTTPA